MRMKKIQINHTSVRSLVEAVATRAGKVISVKEVGRAWSARKASRKRRNLKGLQG